MFKTFSQAISERIRGPSVLKKTLLIEDNQKIAVTEDANTFSNSQQIPVLVTRVDFFSSGMFQPNYEFLLEYLANLESTMTCCFVLVDLVECSQKPKLDNQYFRSFFIFQRSDCSLGMLLDTIEILDGQMVGLPRNAGHQLLYCFSLSLELMDVTVMAHALIIPTQITASLYVY